MTPEVVVIAALFLGMGVVALLKPAFIGTFFDVRFGRRPRRGGGAELGTRAMMLLVVTTDSVENGSLVEPFTGR